MAWRFLACLPRLKQTSLSADGTPQHSCAPPCRHFKIQTFTVTSSIAGEGENFVLTKDNMPPLKDQVEQKIQQMKDFENIKSHVEMTVTSEGLRIELTESASGTFFDSGSAQLNADGKDLLIALAQELGKLPNKLFIEGHTDSKP
jgi:chemotaxis protein MotB